MFARVFSFPNPVDEVAARLVAGGVLCMALLAVVTQGRWLLLVIAYGFVARVLTGPTLSPLGQLVTRVIVPRLSVAPRYVAGPPKRFAQACGVGLSGAAVTLAFGFNHDGLAFALIGVLAIFAALESLLALCVGCKIFGLLMAIHVIPPSVCAECADIWSRPSVRASALRGGAPTDSTPRP